MHTVIIYISVIPIIVIVLDLTHKHIWNILGVDVYKLITYSID
jgi:hypothetical protein